MANFSLSEITAREEFSKKWHKPTKPDFFYRKPFALERQKKKSRRKRIYDSKFCTFWWCCFPAARPKKYHKNFFGVAMSSLILGPACQVANLGRDFKSQLISL